MTLQFLFNQLRTDVIANIGEFHFRSFNELKVAMPEVAGALEGKHVASSGLCLYRGTGYSVQSTLCSGHAIQGSEAIGAHACCSACMALLLDHAIAERARHPSNQPGAELNKYARHDTIGSMDAAVKRLRKS